MKVPVKLPSRLMAAEPITPLPLTVAAPTDAAEPQRQPVPLRLPLTDGALPADGLSTSVVVAASTSPAAANAGTRMVKISRGWGVLFSSADRLYGKLLLALLRRLPGNYLQMA